MADARQEEMAAAYAAKEEAAADAAKALRRSNAKLEMAGAALETARRDIGQVCLGLLCILYTWCCCWITTLCHSITAVR